MRRRRCACRRCIGCKRISPARPPAGIIPAPGIELAADAAAKVRAQLPWRRHKSTRKRGHCCWQARASERASWRPSKTDGPYVGMIIVLNWIAQARGYSRGARRHSARAGCVRCEVRPAARRHWQLQQLCNRRRRRSRNSNCNGSNMALEPPDRLTIRRPNI